MKKNELDRLLLMCEKALQHMEIEGKNPGMKFDKGTEYETRMKWMRALGCLGKLKNYFDGKNSIRSICKDCVYFVHRDIGNRNWSVCNEGQGREKLKHQYENYEKFKGG